MEKDVKPKRFFISYSSKDKEFVDRFTGALNYKKEGEHLLDCLEIIIDKTFLFTGIKIEEEIFTKKMDECDGYIFIVSNSSIKSEWVSKEYQHAMKTIETNKDFMIIPILIEDLNKNYTSEIKVNFNLNQYKYSDFRSHFSFLSEIDNLIKNSLCPNIDPISLQELIYKNSITPNIENLRFKKIMDYALNDAFNKHISPMQQDINRMIKLQQANEKIMTIEAIAEKEKTANDNVWIISTHLNNDINDIDIKKSVKVNQTKNPNIKYTYFVPKNSVLIDKRIEAYRNFHLKENEGKTYEFIKIDKDEAIMPFSELVIYDPDDYTTVWGYVELNYNDVVNDKNSVFLKMPQRNLCPIVELLKNKKEEHKNTISKQGKENEL